MLNKMLKYLCDRVGRSLHSRIFFAPGMDWMYRFYQEQRIRQIRRKPRIKVLFIVGEASTWKTESLYCRMLEHPRFEPILGVTATEWYPEVKKILVDYVERRGYEYIDLDKKGNSIKKIAPDIKFYYKPYESSYRHGLYYDYNLRSLVCAINYGFHLSAGSANFHHAINDYSWREFVENKAVVNAMEKGGKYTGNKAITGLPLQDILSLPKTVYDDPWKKVGDKKKIIYAPHHSFKGCNGNFIEYATFLEFGEFMLEMAKKYADKVQWVFKPHPALISKLEKKWGKERAMAYYDEWKKMPYSQIELGAYNDIFAYSDAMIHDCSSFIVEYQYTHNPVLFLEEHTRRADEMFLNEFGYDAYKTHYHASTKEQIETFIRQVINGEDPKAKEREEFFETYLRIPNNKTASDNIIDVILGDNE